MTDFLFNDDDSMSLVIDFSISEIVSWLCDCSSMYSFLKKYTSSFKVYIDL